MTYVTILSLVCVRVDDVTVSVIRLSVKLGGSGLRAFKVKVDGSARTWFMIWALGFTSGLVGVRVD